jgi:hypothetical protein
MMQNLPIKRLRFLTAGAQAASSPDPKQDAQSQREAIDWRGYRTLTLGGHPMLIAIFSRKTYAISHFKISYRHREKDCFSFQWHCKVRTVNLEEIRLVRDHIQNSRNCAAWV